VFTLFLGTKRGTGFNPIRIPVAENALDGIGMCAPMTAYPE